MRLESGGGKISDDMTCKLHTPEGPNAYEDAELEDPSPASVSAQKITYQPDKVVKNNQVAYGTEFSLHAKSSGACTLSYQSSDKRILSIDSKGKAIAKGYGKAYITIRAAAENGYRAASKKIKLTVVPKKVEVKELNLQGEEIYFEWEPDDTVDGYQFACADDKKFTRESRGFVKSRKNSIRFSNFRVENDKIYYRFRAYKKIGNKTYYGEWSSAWYVKF